MYSESIVPLNETVEDVSERAEGVMSEVASTQERYTFRSVEEVESPMRHPLKEREVSVSVPVEVMLNIVRLFAE